MGEDSGRPLGLHMRAREIECTRLGAPILGRRRRQYGARVKNFRTRANLTRLVKGENARTCFILAVNLSWARYSVFAGDALTMGEQQPSIMQ
jgi:hypothetical protein